MTRIKLQKVDIRDRTPKYLQAQDILIAAIRSGQLQPGEKLPSTADICELVDISLITAQKALGGLVHAGWLRREVGRGTFVRDDVRAASNGEGVLSVGLLFPPHVNIDDYYHSTLINALRHEARSASRQIEFFFHDQYDLPKRQSPQTGMICVHPPLEESESVERIARRCPVVLLGGTLPGSGVPFVDCDNRAAARQAVRHLLDLGHRRFIVLTGPTNLTNSRDRLAGAAAELAERGLSLDAQTVLSSSDSVILDDDTRKQFEQALVGPSRPTAVFAGGFYLALTAMQLVRRAGLGIPEEISMIGFDDPPSAALLAPPLSTVRQPLPAMAQLALRWLCDNAGAPGASLAASLPAELVRRASTGPVPAGSPVRRSRPRE